MLVSSGQSASVVVDDEETPFIATSGVEAFETTLTASLCQSSSRGSQLFFAGASCSTSPKVKPYQYFLMWPPHTDRPLRVCTYVLKLSSVLRQQCFRVLRVIFVDKAKKPSTSWDLDHSRFL